MIDQVPVDSDSAILIEALKQQLALTVQPMSDHDEVDQFPTQLINGLRENGLLRAPLPRSAGGLGWGTEEAEAFALYTGLRVIGYRSLAAGRIVEAHVNAIALIFRYGDTGVRNTAAAAVLAGHLFGLWVAPGREPVRATRHGSSLHVNGCKPFCTAAEFATRAVITVLDDQGLEQMLLVDATQARFETRAPPLLHGMRGTSTRAVEFDCEVSLDRCIGGAGDYVREPDFSVGAWRTSAVTAGGAQRLVDETIRQLRERGRHTNPNQAARIGQMLMKCGTAEIWAASAARRSVSPDHDQRFLTGYVNLARVAIELACLEIITLVQRGLGLAGFLGTNPVEGMMRDLATYLRQPAGDEALAEASITFAETEFPSALGDCLSGEHGSGERG